MGQKPETLGLHAGWRRDPATKAVAVQNPTAEVLEQRRAALQGSVAALAVA